MEDGGMIFCRSLLAYLAALLLPLLLVGGGAVRAQATPPPTASKTTLADLVRNLPEYAKPGLEMSFTQAFENATAQDREAAVPGLVAWLKSDQPRVRSEALLSIGLLYMPNEHFSDPPCSIYLPVEDVPVVAAQLRDTNPGVRDTAFLALRSVENCGHGIEQLVALVVPMLSEPDILSERPVPSSAEGEEQMLAKMTPEQQANFKARSRFVIKAPATGPLLLGILATSRQPSNTLDDAMIAFLQRKDQTKTTLGESLHTLAVRHTSERVNDEALRLVFEQKAMTVFLMQFIADLRLTPEQITVQKERLMALANDVSGDAALRAAAKTVATCWAADRTAFCQPTSEEFGEEERNVAAKHR